MKHQPFIKADGSVLYCNGEVIEHKFGDYYKLPIWRVFGNGFGWCSEINGLVNMCCPVAYGNFESMSFAIVKEDEPLRYALAYNDLRSGVALGFKPSIPMWSGFKTDNMVVWIDGFNNIYHGNTYKKWNVVSYNIDNEDDVFEVLRIVPILDQQKYLMTVAVNGSGHTLMLDEAMDIVSEVMVDGLPVYKCSILGDRIVYASKGSDFHRKISEGVFTLSEPTIAISCLHGKKDIECTIFPLSISHVPDPSITEQDANQWNSILTQAAALGPDCQERVRQHKELADHPPSSVCCGAKAKHRERMLQRAKDIIEQFKSGVAVVDEFSVDDKDKT